MSISCLTTSFPGRTPRAPAWPPSWTPLPPSCTTPCAPASSTFILWRSCVRLLTFSPMRQAAWSLRHKFVSHADHPPPPSPKHCQSCCHPLDKLFQDVCAQEVVLLSKQQPVPPSFALRLLRLLLTLLPRRHAVSEESVHRVALSCWHPHKVHEDLNSTAPHPLQILLAHLLVRFRSFLGMHSCTCTHLHPRLVPFEHGLSQKLLQTSISVAASGNKHAQDRLAWRQLKAIVPTHSSDLTPATFVVQCRPPVHDKTAQRVVPSAEPA